MRECVLRPKKLERKRTGTSGGKRGAVLFLAGVPDILSQRQERHSFPEQEWERREVLLVARSMATAGQRSRTNHRQGV